MAPHLPNGAGRSAARLLRRLFVSTLLLSLVLPPAAAAGGPLTTVEHNSVWDLPAQEGEPPPADGDVPSELLPYIPGLAAAAEPSPTPATPPDAGTPELPPPSSAPAPVLLRVRSRQAVVLPGQPFTVTVSAAGTNAEEVLPTGLALRVQLPEGVAAVSAGAALEWPLPSLNPGEELSQTLLLAADGNSPLLDIEATVAGETALPVTQALWLAVAAPAATVAPGATGGDGASNATSAHAPTVEQDTAAAAQMSERGAVVAASRRGVTLALPSGAAPLGATLRYSVFFDWRNAVQTPSPVEPSAEPTATPMPEPLESGSQPPVYLYLPGIWGGEGEELAAGKAAEPTVEPPTATLPAATPESTPDIPSVQDSGIDFYALWTLSGQTAEGSPAGDAAQPLSGAAAETNANVTADANNAAANTDGEGGEIERLDAEALLLVDVRHLVAAGVDPLELQLWTREETGDAWSSLHARYDEDAQVLRAWLPHFSQFGLGEGMAPSGDLLPSTGAFTVDALNGGAEAAIPIDATVGLGGLRPDLSLRYSSVLLDDLHRSGGLDQITAQASSVGLGWNLSGVSYIAALLPDSVLDDETANAAKRFALVLGGQRVEISYSGNQWQTNPALFAQIAWLDDTYGNSNGVRDFYGWVVTTADGMRYEFGDAGPYDANKWDSANAYSLEQTSGGQSYRMTRRWYLRKVTDPSGNSMEGRYRTERRYKSCQVESSWVANGWNWYTSSVDPVDIYWSANSSAGQEATLRVHFTYASSARGDTLMANSAPGECTAGFATQPMLGVSNRLDKLDVQVKSEGAWRTLRSYQFYQAEHPFTLRGRTVVRPYLVYVDERGKDGVQLLRRTSFSYTFSNINDVRLLWADNNWGGSVNYSYGAYSVSCSNSVCPYGKNRYPVAASVAYNGLSNQPRASVRTEYVYTQTVGAGGESGAVANDGGFLGFGAVEVTHFALNSSDPSTALQWELLASVSGSTGADAGRDNPDPRRGRLARREVWSRNARRGVCCSPPLRPTGRRTGRSTAPGARRRRRCHGAPARGSIRPPGCARRR